MGLYKYVSRTLALCLALAAAACDSPPTKEIAVAEAELQRALDGDADVFAGTVVDEAESALQAAHRQVARRQYRAALSAALDATQKSREALDGSVSAKRALQTQAQAVLKTAEESLARATQMILPKASPKAPRDLAECQSAFDQARDFTDTLGRHLSEADLVSVYEEVPVVKSAVERLDKACEPAPATPPRAPGRRRAPRSPSPR